MGWFWLSSLLVTGALGPALYTGKHVFERDYMDSAAVKLGPLLDGRTVALTEAGRMAYWSNATVVDVVGLNTPEMALRPPSVSFLETVAPDVVMFHVAGTVDGRKMVRRNDRAGQVARVNPKRLRRAVRRPYRSYLGSERDEYVSDDVPTKISAVVLADFLSQHPEYQIVAVRYGRGFNHVYGFRSDLEDRAAMLEALVSAGPSAPESSYAVVREMRPGLACRLGAWVSPNLPGAAQICASDG